MSSQGEGSTFVLRTRLSSRDREEFLDWCWREFGERGLLGVHEGSVFEPWNDAESRHRPEEWEVDFGLVDQSRDWIGKAGEADAELYFDSEASAQAARARAERAYPSLSFEIREQRPEDWNARWRESFKGIDVPPHFKVLPPWDETPAGGEPCVLRINPGAGFGTGSHETTRLCLTALGTLGRLDGRRVLDFGSGSGILSIAAALKGATVDAVEIDTLANENAAENCVLNGVADRVRIGTELFGEPARDYDVVLANILRPVLLEFAERLVGNLADGGELILSGLIESDVAPVRATYGRLMRARGRADEPEIGFDGEWRSLHWRSRR